MGSEETLITSLRAVLHVLQESQLAYALAGGLAYSALVEPRATIDIDLLVLLQNASMPTIFQRLEQHFETLITHPEPMRFPLISIWRAVGITQQREVILDFLLGESPFHHMALNRAIAVNFWGLPLRVVSLEDLVLLKACARRPQDLADVSTIYNLFYPELDHNYLAHWMQQLNLPPLP